MLKIRKILLTPFIVLMLVMSSATSVAFAENVEDDNLDVYEFQSIVQSYIEMTNEGLIKFDEEKAISDGQSYEIIEAGRAAEELSIQYVLHESEIQPFVSFKYYGNWCGPGYGGGTPIDSIDQACKTHDLCYSNNGMYNCACDRKLVDTLAANWGKYTVKQRTYASGVITYFSLAPCKK